MVACSAFFGSSAMVAQRGGARGVAPCRTTQPLTVTAKAASSDSARLRGDGSESVQKAAERKQSLAVKDQWRESIMDDMMVLGRPVLWETMFRFMDGNVSPSTGLTPEQVQAGLSKGKLTLLDVRSPDDGASDVEWMNPGFFIAGTMRKGVVPGAVNVPLYSLIGGNTFYKQARRAGFSYIFGVLNGQEVRSDFVKEVLAAIPKKDTPIVVMCDSKYPTMETAKGRNFGIRSRGLQAVYYLLKVGGYKNVTFMQGGFLGWDSAGLPVTPFSDPDAQPFAQRNVGKMASILFFLVFVTSIKTGAVFVPILFFAPEGTMSQYGLSSLDEARSSLIHTFSLLLHLEAAAK